jgi:tetratricopeptide (TPR) repeat protein
MDTPDRKPLFSGNLTETPFPKLLFEITSMGVSGLLVIARGKAKKGITFDHGRPARITSNLLQEVLGRHLVAIGKITEEDYQQTLAIAFKSHRLHGDILIERGLLSGGELSKYLKEQSVAKLLNIFKWTEGDYSFFKRDFISPLRSDFTALSPEEAIFLGIKHHYGIDRLLAAVEPYKTCYLYPGSQKSQFLEKNKLADDERWLIDLADGTKTVKETIEMSPLQSVDSYRLIYGAISADVLAIKESPKTPGEAAAPRDEEATKRDVIASRVLATYHEMSTKSYFEVLGVDERTPPQDLKRAYLKLAKEYHPDSFPPDTLPLVEKTANQIFDLVTKAYKVLVNDEEKKRYIRSLAAPEEKVAFEKTHDIMNAELMFQKGRVFLKKRDWKNARECLQWAVKLMPEEAEYLAYFAWATFLCAQDKSGSEVVEAIKQLKKAASLNPSLEIAQLFLGGIYKTQGLKDIAAFHFKKAVDINPESVEAKRELAALGVNQREDAKGLFGPKNR